MAVGYEATPNRVDDVVDGRRGGGAVRLSASAAVAGT